VNRRKFITFLSGAAPAWPLATRAQQPERVRRIGMLLPAIMNDDAFQDRMGAFLQGLQEAGWSIGRNVRIDTRWGANNPTEIRRHATELAALAPDVVVAFAASTVGAMLQATSSVPIVFPGVADPVAAGFVDSLARPGRNATGFLLFEYGMAGKLLELLKEIAPGMIRAGVLRDPATPSGPAQFGVIQAAASSLRVEVSLINMRDAPEIENAIAAFAHSPNKGLIVPASGSAAVHRTQIIMLAARHRLPAVYSSRFYIASGGLISYGPDYVDQFRRAAGYVDRILKGEKPADLPVQAPTKYELVVNLKTAKTLGLEIPPSVLARADEVIE
jgi:putative tryptophan/tyrosine transport system substrate-binding protein